MIFENLELHLSTKFYMCLPRYSKCPRFFFICRCVVIIVFLIFTERYISYTYYLYGFIELLQPSMRSLQVLEAKMHARLHLLPLLPTGRAAKVRQRPQDLRCQQRRQASQRAPPPPEGRCRPIPRLRGGGAREGPGLRLRRGHLLSPETSRAPPEGARRRQCGLDPSSMWRFSGRGRPSGDAIQPQSRW